MVRLARGNETLLHPVCRLKGQLRQGLFPRYGLRRLALYRGEARPHLRRAVPRYRQPRPSILWITTTIPCSSLLCCRRHFRTCSFRPIWASPSAWREYLSFNLREVCRTARVDRESGCRSSGTPAPDFSTGGEMLYDAAQMRRFIDRPRLVRLRARWRYQKEGTD